MSIPVRQMLVKENKYKVKCPNTLHAESITIHNTYNDASANNEVQYMINNVNQISYHFAVDDKEVVQGLPLDRNAWAAGDNNGPGNRKSLHLEICYSKSGGERYIKAEANAIKFVAQLLHEHKWGIDKVKKHEDWSGKHCPHRILDEGRWQQFLKEIEKELKALSTPKKTIHIYTGGYGGEALGTVQVFLAKNKWWYQPSRNKDGTLSFLVGGFAEGSEAAVSLEAFLKEHNWWYQIK
jgi:N-acetylmuramoyl-L-alanine amidase CwlA